MDSTSINISNSSSASFTLPPASSLNVSGVDGEIVDIRASKQLLSNSIWYPAYIPDLMVFKLFILSQRTHKHTCSSCHAKKIIWNYWSKKPSFILIAWGWFSKLKTTEFLNSTSHQPFIYTLIHTYMAGAGNGMNQYLQICLLFVCSYALRRMQHLRVQITFKATYSSLLSSQNETPECGYSDPAGDKCDDGGTSPTWIRT